MAMPPIEALVSAHCLNPLPNRNVTNSRPGRQDGNAPARVVRHFGPGQETDHRLSRLLRARRERPRGRAAECDQQFPPSDGDCHAPLPCEVRQGKDTTPRACCPKGAQGIYRITTFRGGIPASHLSNGSFWFPNFDLKSTRKFAPGLPAGNLSVVGDDQT